MIASIWFYKISHSRPVEGCGFLESYYKARSSKVHKHDDAVLQTCSLTWTCEKKQQKPSIPDLIPYECKAPHLDLVTLM